MRSSVGVSWTSVEGSRMRTVSPLAPSLEVARSVSGSAPRSWKGVEGHRQVCAGVDRHVRLGTDAHRRRAARGRRRRGAWLTVRAIDGSQTAAPGSTPRRIPSRRGPLVRRTREPRTSATRPNKERHQLHRRPAPRECLWLDPARPAREYGRPLSTQPGPHPGTATDSGRTKRSKLPGAESTRREHRPAGQSPVRRQHEEK
jgi:hypothetical protein